MPSRKPARARLIIALAFPALVGLPGHAAAAPPPVVVGAAADALVAQESPTTNFGSANALGADNSPLAASFVRFDVTGVTAPVSRARLRLFVTNPSSNGPRVHLSPATWTEPTVTWNNRPAPTGGPIADLGSVAAGAYREWDVTTVVTGDGTYSFNLVADSSDGTDFNSREAASNRPELVLELGTPPDSEPPLPPPPPPPAGIIATVAGTGSSGYSGDGGPATGARLNAPRTLAADALGNLYIVDTMNHRVRKVDPAGRITTLAGTGTAGFSGDGGPATTAKLNTPHGIAVDPAGNIYIADPPNQRIRKVDARGVITTVAGTGSGGYNGDGISATSARLNYPKGVEIGLDGSLYIADNNNHRVRRVDATGIITTVAGRGAAGFSGDGGPASQARLNEPRNVTFDTAGNLYIVDQENDRIRRVDRSGIITTFAGNGSGGATGDGGPAVAAGIDLPRDVAVDTAGNVYIVQESRNRVRRVDPSGIITTFAGTGSSGSNGDGGPATQARLRAPRGVASNPATGALLVADTGNHRIRSVN